MKLPRSEESFPRLNDGEFCHKCMKEQRLSHHDDSFAIIPDQGKLEDIVWLMNQKIEFENRVDVMRSEWERFKIDNAPPPLDPKILQNKVNRLHKEWNEQHGVELIQISEFGKDWIANITSVEEIDFRPHRTLHKSSERLCQGCMEQIELVSEVLHSNVKAVVRKEGERKDVPMALDELSLIAWGTPSQMIHTDFINFQPNAHGEPVEGSIEAVGGDDGVGWCGTVMHHFVSCEPKLAGPSLGWETSHECEEPHRVDVIPQGFVCMFGPNFRHFGGVSVHRHTRLHAQHLDPTSPEAVRQIGGPQIPPSVHPAPSAAKQSELMAMVRELAVAAGSERVREICNALMEKWVVDFV